MTGAGDRGPGAGEKAPSSAGRWVVVTIFVVAVVLSYLRWRFVPKTNPKETDPGSPYYSPR